MSEQIFLQQFAQMPENLRQEVVDFTEYLMMKYKVAEKTPKKVAKFGSAKGKYILSPDFDEPTDNLKKI